jgi:molecular chaperone GrpE
MSKKTQIEIQDENDVNGSHDIGGPNDKMKNESDASSPPESNETVEQAAEKPEDDLAAKLEASERQAREHYDRLLRVSAEFDNYKKRTSREMQDLAKFANEKLLRELLSVVDNLERAVASCEHDPDQPDPVLQGVNLTLNETLKLLERYQVKPIDSLGEPFDPNFHQAMMQEEVDNQPENTVVREMQKGYLLHDRLLRPALVAVSKSKQNKDDDN